MSEKWLKEAQRDPWEEAAAQAVLEPPKPQFRTTPQDVKDIVPDRPTTISAKKFSLIEKIKARLYKGRPIVQYDLPTGTRYRSVEPTREQQPLRTMAGIAAYLPAEYYKGRALYTTEFLSKDLPEKVAKKIAPAMKLTPKEKAFGDALAMYGGLKSAGKIIYPLAKYLPLREAYRLIISGGGVFGLRNIAEQAPKKLLEGKPIDEGELIAETLIGSMFGAAEGLMVKGIALARYRKFIKLRPEFKKIPRSIILKVDEAFRAAEQGMSKATLRRVYGKHIKQFADIVKREFGREAARTAIQKAAPAFRPPPEQEVMQRYAERIQGRIQRGGETAKTDVQAIIQQGRMELKQALTKPPSKPIQPPKPKISPAAEREKLTWGNVRRRAGVVEAQDFGIAPEKMEALGLKKIALKIKGEVFAYKYGEEGVYKHADILQKANVPSDIKTKDIIPGYVDEKGKFIDPYTQPPAPAEPVKAERPPLRRGLADVAVVGKAYKGFLNILEPAIPARQKVGRGPVAEVMRGTFGKRDRARVEFEQKQLENLDRTNVQLEREFAKYPAKDLENIMLTRGHGLKGKARALQVRAFAELPPELKKPQIRRTIDEIAEFNYKELQKVAGDDINKVKDYFYGIYKNPKKVTAFLQYWKTTKRFTKQKIFPTYADAKAYGLEIRDPNPISNLKSEYMAIAQLKSMKWLRDELMRTGEGRYIALKENAPAEWLTDKNSIIGKGMIPEPTFNDVLVEPTLGKLINNEISVNKISQVPVLNAFRQINNFVRTVKFIGSGFHLKNIAKQSFADSGYFGVYKPTAYKGLARGFRKDDPIFKTLEYLDYIEQGGGHRYSVESEARKAFSDVVKQLTKSERMILKAGGLPLKIPVGFVDWMFNSYIPKVKYSKYLDLVGEKQKKLSRELYPAEKQEVIKEIQNFYGMMNERLFGRSGTVTTALRFVFMAPGYAEGNYRTILKAATQWGDVKASRSRSNIVNSLILSGIAGTVGTLIMIGKWPKKPETAEEMRDLFKIDTGKKDKGGKPIMIDMLSYDKDYWNIYFNVLRGRPDIAIEKTYKRLGGMKAPAAQFVADLAQIAQGKAIYDFKEDKVYHLTDPFLQKVMKTVVHEVQRTVPISAGVFKRAKEKEIDSVLSAVAALTGTQLTTGEKEKEEFKIVRDIWDMQDKREKLSYEINKYDDPWKAVEAYNNTIKKISEAKFATPAIKAKAKKLLIDPKKVVLWKRFPPDKMTTFQIIRAIRENTYQKPYRRDGRLYRRGEAHKGQEEHVKRLQAELARRRKK